MHDGWQVFVPVLDHGHRTDILISDGPNYYRIQVKTVSTKGEDQFVSNRWADSNVDFVVFFARDSNWGVITPAFVETKRRINHKEHRKFKQTRKDFLREFHQM